MIMKKSFSDDEDNNICAKKAKKDSKISDH